MNASEIYRITKEEGRTLYLFDDYNRVAMKIYYDKTRKDIRVFTRMRNGEEIERNRKDKYVFEYMCWGVEVGEDFYGYFRP